jgi:hypothetical protein
MKKDIESIKDTDDVAFDVYKEAFLTQFLGKVSQISDEVDKRVNPNNFMMQLIWINYILLKSDYQVALKLFKEMNIKWNLGDIVHMTTVMFTTAASMIQRFTVSDEDKEVMAKVMFNMHRIIAMVGQEIGVAEVKVIHNEDNKVTVSLDEDKKTIH